MPGEYLADLLSKRSRLNAEQEIRVAHSQLAKKKAIQAIIVVLARMHQKMVGMAVQQTDDELSRIISGLVPSTVMTFNAEPPPAPRSYLPP